MCDAGTGQRGDPASDGGRQRYSRRAGLPSAPRADRAEPGSEPASAAPPPEGSKPPCLRAPRLRGCSRRSTDQACSPQPPRTHLSPGALGFPDGHLKAAFGTPDAVRCCRVCLCTCAMTAGGYAEGEAGVWKQTLGKTPPIHMRVKAVRRKGKTVGPVPRLWPPGLMSALRVLVSLRSILLSLFAAERMSQNFRAAGLGGGRVVRWRGCGAHGQGPRPAAQPRTQGLRHLPF